tara:strand:+ start:4688 stop:6532 length:1845 start_codon:yes stop_codon:yes gene_type:complete
VERFFTRFFIAINVLVIVAIYYLSEIRPFSYENFESRINQLERYDAELDGAVVQTRFGIIKNYDPIVSAINGSERVLRKFEKIITEYPNDKINDNLSLLRNRFDEKKSLTEDFKRYNPILLNAISHFSSIMATIIENQAHLELIESSFDQLNQVYQYQLIDKVHTLFRGVLIYTNVPSEEKRLSLLSLIEEIATEISEEGETLPGLDLALIYAKKILDLQPKLTEISQLLLDIPILTTLSKLDSAFTNTFDEYLTTSNRYRIVLYVLVFLLLIVLRSSFARLTSTVKMLHVEVQRKIRAEKELEEINRQLEQRVADRTKELTSKNKDLNKALSDLEEAQEQLIIQEKMASVGMLTTGVAHEIKNPLNFINNFSDISVDLVEELNEELEGLNGKVDKEALEFIKEITNDLKVNCQKVKEHGDRADNIVKNMLIHSQASSTTKEMVDIKNVMDSSIRSALDKYAIDNKKQEILFKKDYTPDLQKVLCAPQAIARVILYLLDNALYSVLEKQKQKKQADYQPTVSITLENMHDKVYIKIHDNGLGIAKAEIDKVFEPFFTSKPTGMGNTGLGLSICYDIIVKQHKGELKAQSEESLFAEFIIILPVNVHDLTNDPEN